MSSPPVVSQKGAGGGFLAYLDGISEAGLGANLSQDVECCILHLKALSGSPELDYLDLEQKQYWNKYEYVNKLSIFRQKDSIHKV